MPPFNDYQQLRVKEPVSIGSDDDDYAGLQSSPAELVELTRPGSQRGDEPVRIKVEIVLEWLDASDDVITSDRGSFDIQAIRVTARRSPLAGDVIVDTPPLRSQIAYRPIVIDDILPGDRFGVRVTNSSAPEGAQKARILYREIV